MNKRGVSQIEVIFAFLLFIAFVFVALYFLNPTKNPSEDNTVAQQTFNNIIQQANTNFIKYSVVFSDSVVNNAVAVNLSDTNLSLNANAEDYYGNTLPINRDSADPAIIYIKPDSNFSIIKYGEDLPKNYSLPDTPTLNTDDYIIASATSEQIVSENKILQLNSSYYSDYYNTKDKLEISKDKDFSFSFVFNNSDKIEAGVTIPEIANVYSYQSNVKLLRKDGTIKFADVIIKVW